MTNMLDHESSERYINPELPLHALIAHNTPKTQNKLFIIITQHNQTDSLTVIAFQMALKGKIELYVQNHMEHLAPLQS